MSPGLRLDFGVPQGSILGPLLFILYINDLPECLVNCSIGMYADDTVIYFSDFSPVEIKRAVQDDLDRIAQWMDTNRLILNQSKTKGMLFGTRQKLDNAAFDIMLSGNKIERVSKFEYLGVTLDDQLSWKDHITSLSSKASKRLGILARIRTCLTLKAAKCVFNTLVQPLFDYSDSAWGFWKDAVRNSSVCKTMQHA